MDLAKKSIFKGFESPVCWMCLCYDVRKESKEEYRIRGAWRWRVAPLPVSDLSLKLDRLHFRGAQSSSQMAAIFLNVR